MKLIIFSRRFFMIMLLLLLFNSFGASAQNTTIWLVNHAETGEQGDDLSAVGQQRAADLAKALKHDGIEVIYVADKKSSWQTASPLAARDKILPRIYTDSVQRFAEIIRRNFTGKNVLIVANSNTIIQFLSAFGAESPFDALDKDDYDQLFSIVIKTSGDVVASVSYYGKRHHTNAIPQSYIMDSFSPGVPGH